VIRPAATLIGQHSRPIMCLSSSYQSRRGAWAEDLGSELVSCNDQGRLCIWQVKDEQSVQCVATVEAGQPCCSLAVRRGFVVAARVDGCVQLYGLVSAAAQLAATAFAAVDVVVYHRRGCYSSASGRLCAAVWPSERTVQQKMP
jgi:hypothetical protein